MACVVVAAAWCRGVPWREGVAMTVAQLISRLEQLEAAGHGGAAVLVLDGESEGGYVVAAEMIRVESGGVVIDLTA